MCIKYLEKKLKHVSRNRIEKPNTYNQQQIRGLGR